MTSYPRETVEFLPITITVDGATVTENIEFALTQARDRPTVWVAAQILDARTGLMIENLATGTWHVWARITDTPEAPVIDCGTFHIN